MPSRVLGALAATLLLASAPARLLAEESAPRPPGQVERIATRPGVSVPIYSVWRANARATVVLYSGGAGGYGQIGGDGWPAGGGII